MSADYTSTEYDDRPYKYAKPTLTPQKVWRDGHNDNWEPVPLVSRNADALTYDSAADVGVAAAWRRITDPTFLLINSRDRNFVRPPETSSASTMAGTKDATMYSTLDGAKNHAKQLKRILSASGLIYSLAKCQAAVARAGGFGDWHDLTTNLQIGTPPRPLFDFWGALIQQLPAPCHLPVRSYLRDRDDVSFNKRGLSEKWVRDVIPYCASLELVHRKHSSVVMPGSGKGQKLRLEIVSGLLLNIEGHQDFEPELDPETLSIVLRGRPASLLPTLAQKADFAQEIDVLVSSEILRLKAETITIIGPPNPSLRDQIVRRAQRWNSQKEPEVKTYDISEELAARLKLQSDLDRAESRPKAPYDEMEYLGVALASRFSVVHEFKTMQAVVDEMASTIRPRVASIWCDSKACAVYAVEIKLGMNHPALAEQIHACFQQATDGFNGLTVHHGSSTEFFNPEWPGFSDDNQEIESDESITF